MSDVEKAIERLRGQHAETDSYAAGLRTTLRAAAPEIIAFMEAAQRYRNAYATPCDRDEPCEGCAEYRALDALAAKICGTEEGEE